jgi:hypothetical protein
MEVMNPSLHLRDLTLSTDHINANTSKAESDDQTNANQLCRP